MFVLISLFNNLKILQFVWFIANCAWSSVSPLLICSTCHRLYPSSTSSSVAKTSRMISFVHLLAGSNIAKKHLRGQRPVRFAFHFLPGIVHNFMHLKRLDLILPLMLWTYLRKIGKLIGHEFCNVLICNLTNLWIGRTTLILNSQTYHVICTCLIYTMYKTNQFYISRVKIYKFHLTCCWENVNANSFYVK